MKKISQYDQIPRTRILNGLAQAIAILPSGSLWNRDARFLKGMGLAEMWIRNE
jgi:hypothetical protein